MSEQQITIDGKKISYINGVLDVASIKLDTENPRLATILSGVANRDRQEVIEEKLLSMEQVRGLKKSILENKGLLEPVIVTRNTDDELVVIEGNCRVACLKEISRNSKEAIDFNTAPAMILDTKDITAMDRSALLSAIHVSPKIAWGAYDKAKFISEMLNQGRTVGWLSKHLRMNNRDVACLLNAFNYTTSYIKQYEPNNPTAHTKFSYFHEFFKKPNLRDQFEREPFLVEQFSKWLNEGKFVNPLCVRNLHHILGSKTGYQKFLESNLEEAMKQMRIKSPNELIPMIKTTRQFTKRLRNRNDKDWASILRAKKSAISAFKNLIKESERLIRDLKEAAEDETNGND